MIDYKFYDTCSLLLKANSLFDTDEKFAISSITLEELENIKTSSVRDPDIKYAARKLLHTLDEHHGEYDVHIFKESMLNPIKEKDLSVTNDTRILATAFDYDNNIHPDEVIFVTNDLALKNIANLFFGDGCIESVNEDFDDEYCGYKEIKFNDDNALELFYSNYKKGLGQFLPENKQLMINEYLIIRNKNNEIIDKLVWIGEGFRNISFSIFDSKHFGKIKPLDIHQQLVADSFNHNKITLVKGPAGSGKTLLALSFLFTQLEHQKIDKIIIFCNTVAAKNSAKLGYLPGSRDEKLLDSQIGNLLASKLGSRIEVERLIDDEKLILLPMSDIRGYDTTGMRAGVYISEAQNLDIPLMKLALQRIGNDSFCIVYGDAKTQVDDISFAGANNGMRRMSKVFRGHSIYGEIELKQIHRSEIGQIAEEM